MVAAPDSFVRHAPSFALIKAHFGLGLVGLLVFSAALVLRAADVGGVFFQPLLLGLVHLCVLGWLMPIAWLHRFAPYVGLKRVPTASELLGERPKQVQFALMHAGLVTFLAGVVADAAPLRVCGAAAFVASSLLFVRNLGVVMARQP